MPRSWNDSLILLNPSLISSSSGGADHNIVRLVGATKTAEARRRRSAKKYRYINLSGLVLSPSQHEYMEAVRDEVEGSLYPLLVFDMRHYLLQGADGLPQLVGAGEGVEKEFQLQKQLTVQGRTASTEIVKYPYWNYPGFEQLDGTDDVFMEEFGVWEGTSATNAVPLSSGWSVDRDSGILTVTADDNVYVTGSFLTKMIFTQPYEATLDGGLYRIDSGISLTQPYEE